MSVGEESCISVNNTVLAEEESEFYSISVSIFKSIEEHPVYLLRFCSVLAFVRLILYLNWNNTWKP